MGTLVTYGSKKSFFCKKCCDDYLAKLRYITHNLVCTIDEMLADVKFFDLLINTQNTQAEIIAHFGNIQLLTLECKLLSVILIAAQLMQPFSALSATQSGIFLTKRTSSLGTEFEVVIASVQPYCFAWRSSWSAETLSGTVHFYYGSCYFSSKLNMTHAV